MQAGLGLNQVINGALRLNSRDKVRLVRGSHIVTRKLFDHEKSYFFKVKMGALCLPFPMKRILR